MRDLRSECPIAIVQAAPIMFNKDACVEKVLRYLDECADHGAELVVFPELFIPCYPFGLTFGFRVGSRDQGGREDWKKYYDNSILAEGPEMRRIVNKAMERQIYVSVGYSEREALNGTLYNSNMMIAPDGTAMNHRKLKPTGSERVVWGDADRDYFPVMETPWGPMGNLICWESYMPLARVALYQKGITLYISPNTNDNPEWQDTATSSTATCSSPGRCIPKTLTLGTRSRSSPTSPAAVAAASSTPSAIRSPRRYGTWRV